MALTRTCRENGEILITSGDRLTIENAAAFMLLLREGLEESQFVTLELEDGVEIDVTGLQLICSACKTAASCDKTFSSHGPLPAGLEKMVEASGARRSAVCKHNLNLNCIWFGGAK